MTATLAQMLLAAGTSPALGLVLKLTAVAALGLAAAGLARKRSAAQRHLILAGTLAALLLLPLASLVAPAVRIAVPGAVPANPTATTGTMSPLSDPAWAAASPARPDGRKTADPAAATSRWRDPTLTDLMCALWVFGTILFLLPIVPGLYEARRMRRASQPWPEAQAVVAGLAREARVRRRVLVLLHDAAPGPMTYGAVRPVIIMPMEARRWPEPDLRRVLTHELEHARRGDWLSHCAARVACGLYWFHPLAWWLSRRLDLEAERACDDAVLRQADALTYADQLVGFAERRLGVPRPPLLAMAGRTHLAARIGSVLDSRQRRGRAGGTAAVLACVTAMVLALAVSPLRVVARDAQQQSNSRFDVASVRQWAPGQIPKRYTNDVRREPGRVSAQFAPLRSLLGYGFNLTGSEPIEGLPEWAFPQGGDFGSAAKFSIDARMPATTTDAQARLMMQSLLADRFKLAWHWTTKPTKVLELVVGTGGLKLKRPDPGTDPKMPNGIETCPSGVSGCAFFSPRAETMTELAGALSIPEIIWRPVVDKTGLSGTFFVPAMVLVVPGGTSVSAPSAPEVLRNVTGLVLRQATDPMPVLVIDHIEKLQGDAGGAPSGHIGKLSGTALHPPNPTMAH